MPETWRIRALALQTMAEKLLPKGMPNRSALPSAISTSRSCGKSTGKDQEVVGLPESPETLDGNATAFRGPH